MPATDKITHIGVNIKSEIPVGIRTYEFVRNNNQFKTNRPKIVQEILYGFSSPPLFLSDINAETTNIKSTITPNTIKKNKEIEMIITSIFYTIRLVCRTLFIFKSILSQY